MLKFIEKEIDNLIKNEDLHKFIVKLNHINFSSLMDKIALTFNIDSSKEIWVQLMKSKPTLVLQGEDVWKESIDYIEFPCNIIITNSTDRVSYIIKSQNTLLKLLNETTGFVFYLYKNKRIVFFNDYDTLGVFDSEYKKQA